MQGRCNIDPLVCGYYQGGCYQGGCCQGGCCPLSGGVCEGTPTGEFGLKVRCYLDQSACRDYREDGFCVRHCCDCTKVHEPGVWEDGQDKEGAD